MKKAKHIILLGFKNVGKTVVGRALAEKMNQTFCDLDQKIELAFENQFQSHLTCRQIMAQHGESFFRNFESTILREMLGAESGVIALGGGTPLMDANQLMLAPHTIIHITAHPEVVYSRIMAGGAPAFFPLDQDPKAFFIDLWGQRNLVYKKLSSFAIDNAGSIEQTVTQILTKL